jgi:hypothetical protein
MEFDKLCVSFLTLPTKVLVTKIERSTGTKVNTAK